MTSYIGSGMLKMSITRKIFFLNYDTWVYTELRHCASEARGVVIGGSENVKSCRTFLIDSEMAHDSLFIAYFIS